MYPTKFNIFLVWLLTAINYRFTELKPSFGVIRFVLNNYDKFKELIRAQLTELNNAFFNEYKRDIYK
jgi:hypothetical protein